MDSERLLNEDLTTSRRLDPCQDVRAFVSPEMPLRAIERRNHEHPIDLPGRWYLQAIAQFFKENRSAKGTFSRLGTP